MHVGARDDLRGAAAGLRRVPRHAARAPAPRAALPPEARRPAARDRPAAVGRRPELQPRVPRAPHRAARARAPRSSCCGSPRGSSPSSSTAPSRCGRCGWSRGSRAARFALISKTHHALIDGIAGVDLAQVMFDLAPGAGRGPAPRRGVAARARADARPSCWPPAPLGAAAHRRGARPRAAAALGHAAGADAARGARGRRGPRRDRRGRGSTRRPPTPLNVEIGPHRRFVVVRSELADFKAHQGRLRRDGQRRRADRRHRRAARLAALARRAHRGPRAARARAGLDPRRGRARHARQPHRRDARAAARLRRGPGRAAARRQARRWTG